jgi:hypothetical protein
MNYEQPAQQHISIPEAVKLCGISRATLYRHIRKGRLTVATNKLGKQCLAVAELVKVYGLEGPEEETITTLETTAETSFHPQAAPPDAALDATPDETVANLTVMGRDNRPATVCLDSPEEAAAETRAVPPSPEEAAAGTRAVPPSPEESVAETSAVPTPLLDTTSDKTALSPVIDLATDTQPAFVAERDMRLDRITAERDRALRQLAASEQARAQAEARAAEWENRHAQATLKEDNWVDTWIVAVFAALVGFALCFALITISDRLKSARFERDALRQSVPLVSPPSAENLSVLGDRIEEAGPRPLPYPAPPGAAYSPAAQRETPKRRVE